MLKVAPLGKRVLKGGFTRPLENGTLFAFTGRAVSDDFGNTGDSGEFTPSGPNIV